MKLQLQLIPTEVWVDVYRYPGKSRKELGEIADKLGRKFAEFLQFYLHEWGKRTLCCLQFKKEGIYKSRRWEADGEKLDFVQAPMPENIKFFERFRISHFDSSTIDFLHRISTLFLFNEVNLQLMGLVPNDVLTYYRTILGYLAPLLHGIHSLAFDQNAIPLVEEYFGPKLAQVKMITLTLWADPATVQTRISFCLNWLTSDELLDPAEPRLLVVWYCPEIFQPFLLAVQQQFLSAKRQCTFSIGFMFCARENLSANNFHLENTIGEQLDGQFDEGVAYFQIFRHQTSFARTKLQEWVSKCYEKSSSSNCIDIDIYRYVTTTPFDANAGANEVDENAVEEEEDGPSTSKKAKLT